MPIPVTIADDSMMSRKNIKKMLPPELSGEITEATNGKEALEAIYAGKAEILFLDLQMPIMDGYQVLEEIQLQKLKVIVFVISADIQPKAIEKVIALGAVRFLQKPLAANELHSILFEVGVI